MDQQSSAVRRSCSCGLSITAPAPSLSFGVLSCGASRPGALRGPLLQQLLSARGLQQREWARHRPGELQFSIEVPVGAAPALLLPKPHVAAAACRRCQRCCHPYPCCLLTNLPWGLYLHLRRRKEP